MSRMSWLVLALVACGQEYELSTVEGPAAAPLAPPARSPRSEPDQVAVGREPVRSLPPISHTDTFDLGADTPAEVADYLFVIDPSASMERVVHLVQAGMSALSTDGVFPADARIAVMTTTPADLEHPDQPHRSARMRELVVWDPGFQGLVDADRIEAARRLPSPYGERFGLDGCDAWFTPTQQTPQGMSCLVAHTQLQLAPVHTEAGLTALMQLLQRGEPLFRSGAAVNVVFVSDTHDPGIPESSSKHLDELLILRPDAAELAELAYRTQDLASFRIHAIAPERKCSSEKWSHLGPVYLEAALDSGGERLDVCSAEPAEYVGFIRNIARNGALPQRAVLPVRKPGDVVEVAVDGAAVGFTLSSDGGAVVLDGAVPERHRRVEVRYATPEVDVKAVTPAAARPVRR